MFYEKTTQKLTFSVANIRCRVVIPRNRQALRHRDQLDWFRQFLNVCIGLRRNDKSAQHPSGRNDQHPFHGNPTELPHTGREFYLLELLQIQILVLLVRLQIQLPAVVEECCRYDVFPGELHTVHRFPLGQQVVLLDEYLHMAVAVSHQQIPSEDIPLEHRDGILVGSDPIREPGRIQIHHVDVEAPALYGGRFCQLVGRGKSQYIAGRCVAQKLEIVSEI